ncbi:MAG: prepilin-type N-terminal cleavage/methylation domain-containing protein [Bacteroidales bacterium]|nr:prepilin-type N-terminal cleavage/methylation domain-containing protein [Bacteroidales bacterium]MDD3665271.1 prepilin-type N-terminal cleavage/methylation domain-containing protein [Bacteroidales bacterium]
MAKIRSLLSSSKIVLKAYTLNELLVVLIIIGILILLALPSLLPLITKAKTTEAQMQLTHLHTLEMNYFYINSTFTDDFEELGFDQQKTVKDNGKANYLIEVVEFSQNGFKARATSVVDFDRDGIYNVWELDQDKNLKETVKD